MNTNSSLILLAVIGGFLAVDWFFYDWALSLFLAQRFIDLLGWVAFWR